MVITAAMLVSAGVCPAKIAKFQARFGVSASLDLNALLELGISGVLTTLFTTAGLAAYARAGASLQLEFDLGLGRLDEALKLRLEGLQLQFDLDMKLCLENPLYAQVAKLLAEAEAALDRARIQAEAAYRAVMAPFEAAYAAILAAQRLNPRFVAIELEIANLNLGLIKARELALNLHLAELGRLRLQFDIGLQLAMMAAIRPC